MTWEDWEDHVEKLAANGLIPGDATREDQVSPAKKRANVTCF